LQRLGAGWSVLLGLALIHCGGSPTPTPTTPTPPASTPTAPAPPPPAGTLSGTVIDTLSERGLGGVAINVDGVGLATSGADGTFTVPATPPEQVRVTTLSSASTIQRTTHLRAPGPAATLSLIPASFDLAAYDQMARATGGTLHRWTAAPRVVVQTRALQFTNISDTDYTAIASAMTDSDVTDLMADLTWALPQLTGNTFTTFADQQRETAAEGDRVHVSRTGLIVVARYDGLTSATGYWGYTRWAWNAAGEMQAGIVMLDRSFETSGSRFRRSLRAHEFGHALGYNHVTLRTSVMNTDARTEPNAFDKDAARIAFQRPPLNRTPDIDPDPFTGNLRALTQLVWSGDR
jgi:hypothetical protein